MMKDLPEENTPHNLQLIIDECTRLNLLVNDLLNLSRLQSKTEHFIDNKFNITKENPKIFVDTNDVINTLNWDYPTITDVELLNGKIITIKEHEIIQPAE